MGIFDVDDILNAGYTTPVAVRQLPRVLAFIDETGDIHLTGSPTLALVAVLIGEEHLDDLRVTTAGLRGVIGTDQPLHWSQHFRPKHRDRRMLAARCLGRLPVTIVIVIVEKASIPAGSRMARDRSTRYAFAMRLVLERVAFAARSWQGGPRQVKVWAEAVKGLPHDEISDYLQFVQASECRSNTSTVPWQYIADLPQWRDKTFESLQLADLYAGTFNAAMCGHHDCMECGDLLALWSHQLYRDQYGRVLRYGLKVLGDHQIVTGRPWWEKVQSR